MKQTGMYSNYRWILSAGLPLLRDKIFPTRNQTPTLILDGLKIREHHVPCACRFDPTWHINYATWIFSIMNYTTWIPACVCIKALERGILKMSISLYCQDIRLAEPVNIRKMESNFFGWQKVHRSINNIIVGRKIPKSTSNYKKVIGPPSNHKKH